MLRITVGSGEAQEQEWNVNVELWPLSLCWEGSSRQSGTLRQASFGSTKGESSPSFTLRVSEWLEIAGRLNRSPRTPTTNGEGSRVGLWSERSTRSGSGEERP